MSIYRRRSAYDLRYIQCLKVPSGFVLTRTSENGKVPSFSISIVNLIS